MKKKWIINNGEKVKKQKHIIVCIRYDCLYKNLQELTKEQYKYSKVNQHLQHAIDLIYNGIFH